ncbi:MAG: aspartate aminotransferase family protein, partial [Bacteroidota bacterium]|nr:aspartate aminotransferase family protein [Bacteroidota bacterium]
NYVLTEDAQYVQGQDNTLIGSRSGSNAISVWMILMTYGPHDWFEKIHILNYRASWLCKELRKLNIEFFRNPDSNIVTIRANEIDADIVKHYRLVPDTHDGNPNWYKIVIMDHVHIDHLKLFIDSVKQKLNKK